MTDDLIRVLTLVSALGCRLVAGVFFAFSTFVIKALARFPASGGIAAMQPINLMVINPLFMTVFLGTAAVCTALSLSSLLIRHKPGALCLLIASLFYLFGTVLVTRVFNVPWNNALARVEPVSANAAALWARYPIRWTAWNHVRTAAALAAAALFTIALVKST
jgi:uncharacterized membrane protein